LLGGRNKEERMARIEDIERRLQNWARWKLGATHSRLGYAAMRWAGGVVTPGRRESVIPTIDCEAEETDRAVQALEPRLRATVEVEYLQGCSLRRKAQQLACSEPAVKARIWQAHRQLSRWLADKVEATRCEQARVAQLMASQRLSTHALCSA
jgi:hypothetical protein